MYPFEVADTDSDSANLSLSAFQAEIFTIWTKRRFNALVVVGDKRGSVSFGYGKAKEVPPAVDKAVKSASRKMKKVREGLDNLNNLLRYCNFWISSLFNGVQLFEEKILPIFFIEHSLCPFWTQIRFLNIKG